MPLEIPKDHFLLSPTPPVYDIIHPTHRRLFSLYLTFSAMYKPLQKFKRKNTNPGEKDLVGQLRMVS